MKKVIIVGTDHRIQHSVARDNEETPWVRFEFDEKELEEKHRDARAQFKSRQWNFDKISGEIGRGLEYDTIYRLLSEIAHTEKTLRQ